MAAILRVAARLVLLPHLSPVSSEHTDIAKEDPEDSSVPDEEMSSIASMLSPQRQPEQKSLQLSEATEVIRRLQEELETTKAALKEYQQESWRLESANSEMKKHVDSLHKQLHSQSVVRPREPPVDLVTAIKEQSRDIECLYLGHEKNEETIKRLQKSKDKCVQRAAEQKERYIRIVCKMMALQYQEEQSCYAGRQ